MTAHEALSHPFVAEETQEKAADLLPMIKKNFNARKTLHAAIDTIRAINKLREGGAMMSGAMSVDPKPEQIIKPHEETVDGGQVDTAMPDAKTPTPSNQGLWSPPAK